MSTYFYHWNSPVNESKHAKHVGPRPARTLPVQDIGMDAVGGTI